MPRVRAPGILRGMSRVGLRGTEPAVAEETQGIGLSRCALGAGLFVSKAPSGSVPLPLVRVWPMGLANALDSRGWGTRGS